MESRQGKGLRRPRGHVHLCVEGGRGVRRGCALESRQGEGMLAAMRRQGSHGVGHWVCTGEEHGEGLAGSDAEAETGVVALAACTWWWTRVVLLTFLVQLASSHSPIPSHGCLEAGNDGCPPFEDRESAAGRCERLIHPWRCKSSCARLYARHPLMRGCMPATPSCVGACPLPPHVWVHARYPLMCGCMPASLPWAVHARQ
eukprot:365731-Chlamydomonas_euryale.AAC.2